MNVLIVSYFFPPDKAVGGLRPSSFCKFFPEQGIKVHLLTSNEKTCKERKKRKEQLSFEPICTKRPKLREWGYKTKILAILELLHLDTYFFFPDVYFLWIKKAVKQAIKQLQEVRLDAIIATAPPYSSLIVGYKLSKKLGVPLVLDYRDPWNGNPLFTYPKLVSKRAKKLEKKIVNHAKLLVTVGEDYAKLIAETLDIDKNKFKIVYNGYSLDHIPKSFPEKEKGKFVISYFGNFYQLQKKTMQSFFEGLGKFIHTQGLPPEQIVFQYSGHTSRKVIRRMMEKANIWNYFSDLIYLPKEELFNHIARSHLVIDVVPEKTEYMIHTKIYDYALANSHILIVGEKGAIVKLCEKVEQRFTLVDENVENISETLFSLWNKWKEGTLDFGSNKEKLKEYSRKNQAEQFASILIDWVKT